MHYHHDYFEYYYDKKVALELVSGSDVQAVSLEEAKDFFREDRSVEDSIINSIVKSSEEIIQNHTGYNFLDTEYRLHLSSFFEVNIPKLPYKAGSVTVKYDDSDGNEQTLSGSEYTVYSQEEPVRIEFHGSNLPALEDNEDNDYPIRIDLTIGYGTDSSDVPNHFKEAIKFLSMIYWKRDIPMNERQNISPLQISIISSLLEPYRIGRFH